MTTPTPPTPIRYVRLPSGWHYTLQPVDDLPDTDRDPIGGPSVATACGRVVTRLPATASRVPVALSCPGCAQYAAVAADLPTPSQDGNALDPVRVALGDLQYQAQLARVDHGLPFLRALPWGPVLHAMTDGRETLHSNDQADLITAEAFVAWVRKQPQHGVVRLLMQAVVCRALPLQADQMLLLVNGQPYLSAKGYGLPAGATAVLWCGDDDLRASIEARLPLDQGA